MFSIADYMFPVTTLMVLHQNDLHIKNRTATSSVTVPPTH